MRERGRLRKLRGRMIAIRLRRKCGGDAGRLEVRESVFWSGSSETIRPGEIAVLRMSGLRVPQVD